VVDAAGTALAADTVVAADAVDVLYAPDAAVEYDPRGRETLLAA
jgi:hypothetical protein